MKNLFIFDEDDLKEMFGDHVNVLVTKENSGIKLEVLDYTNHD